MNKFFTTLDQHERGKKKHLQTWQFAVMTQAHPDFLSQWINQNGPYLYHGTTAKAADKIQQEGLYPHDQQADHDHDWDVICDECGHRQPQENTRCSVCNRELTQYDSVVPAQSGNFDDYYRTRDGHVYLGTQDYVRQMGYPQGGVLAVDLRKLDPNRFNADEDHFLPLNATMSHPAVQAVHEFDPPPDEDAFHAGDGYNEDLGSWANRVNLGNQPEETHYSLQKGSIAYNGHIPPEAISLVGSGVHNPYRGSDQDYLPADWTPVMASSEGYVTCEQGHEHWGRYGAAGILLRHVDASGQSRYLLTYRSPEVHQGDCWAIPGGAIEGHESAIQGALREMREEILGVSTIIENAQIIHSNDHGGWQYHTVLADVGVMSNAMVNPGNDWETDDVRWMTDHEIDALHRQGRLHPGFADTWHRFRQADASPDELHVSLDVPRHAAKAIYRWARDQDWPEGTELEDPSEYHCTLLYSKTGSHWRENPWWIKELESAPAKISKLESFGPSDSGYAYVLRLESDPIQQHGQDMTDQAGRMGLEVTFPEYKPHITVGYGPTKVENIDPPNIELVLGPSSISEPRIKEETSVKEAGAGEMLDQLSLASVAHNLHYRFEQGTDANDIVNYAQRLLKMIGYTPDEMNTQAAIQSWQQLYPQDRLLEAPAEPRQIEAMSADPYWLDNWIERNGPYVYHKSPSKNFDSIAQNGLLPWDHAQNEGGSVYKDNDGLLPRPGHVYLQSIPDMHRFYDQKQRDEHLYRVDLRKLNPELMNPDEDSLKSQRSRATFGLPEDLNFNNWNTWAPRADEVMSDPSQTAWSMDTPNLSSLRGTMAYGAPIPPDALELMPHNLEDQPLQLVASSIIVKKPEDDAPDWENMNVTPSLNTDWQAMGEDEKHHNDVQFSNDSSWLA